MSGNKGNKYRKEVCEFCGKEYAYYMIYSHQLKKHREELDRKRAEEQETKVIDEKQKLLDEGYEFVGIAPADSNTLGKDFDVYFQTNSQTNVSGNTAYKAPHVEDVEENRQTKGGTTE
jgi:redox-regulated HSP33 family molecular chaperone